MPQEAQHDQNLTCKPSTTSAHLYMQNSAPHATHLKKNMADYITLRHLQTNAESSRHQLHGLSRDTQV